MNEADSNPMFATPEGLEAFAATSCWGEQPQRTLKGELWRRLSTLNGVDFGGNYAVSNYGRVKSFTRRGRPPNDPAERKAWRDTYEGHVLKTGAAHDGHVRFGVKLAGQTRRNYSVARLVLSAFVCEPEGGIVVQFKDGDRSNCTLHNLVWAARSKRALESFTSSERAQAQATKTLEAIQVLSRVPAPAKGLDGLKERWFLLLEELDDRRDDMVRLGDLLDDVESSLWGPA